MKGDKVKVFALAKRYGIKSAEFVELLRKVGFPVTSYQASLDTWDVPIIEERLVRGGLLDASKATTIEEPEVADDKEDTVGWDIVVKVASDEPAEEPASEEPDDEPAAEEPVEETAADEVAAEEPDTEPESETADVDVDVEAEPEPAEEPLPIPTPTAASEPAEPQTDDEALTTASETLTPAAETPAPAAETPTLAPEMPRDEQVSAPAPASKAPVDAPAPIAAEASAAAPQAAAGGASTATPSQKPTPKPRPRAGATKVGKIDLKTLGTLKRRASQNRNVTFTDIRDRENTRRQAERTKQREKSKSRRAGTLGPKKVSTQERKADVVLELPITVKSFSAGTGIGVSQLLGKLMGLGMMGNINAVLDEDTVQILAEEFHIGIKLKQQADIESSLMEEIDELRSSVDEESLESRPPVIAFLGHVDHGKTSLIDAIRKANVVDGEAGGITQHIGAYTVQGPTGQPITIIDTPGHEAFTAMRARGANTTDIVILVVAADDGVMQQTEEAISHARAAEVPIIVALNKIDKANAKPEKVRTQLANLELQDEEWGGGTAVIPVSAIQKTGIDDLLARVLLECELLDLKAHTKGDAMGTVLEAATSEGRGRVATVLVQDGTLKAGDALLAGSAYGTVRRMFDHTGKVVKSAGPSTPIEILGLNDLPAAGDRFYVVRDAATAKDVGEKRLFTMRQGERAEKSKVSLENLFEHIGNEAIKRLNLVLKVDVQGTLEVLSQSLQELSNDEVQVKLVHSGVGGITESDVALAETSGSIVIGFGVVPDEKARTAADRGQIEIRRYNVIYELLEDVQKALSGMLAPKKTEKITGHAEVRTIFRSSRIGNIAGCHVTDGEIKRSYKVRLIRDSKPIYEGMLDSLRRLKDDAREVRAGFDCGIKIKNYEDIKEGDVIESFTVVEEARTLEGLAEG